MKYGEDEPSPLNSNDIINTDKTTRSTVKIVKDIFIFVIQMILRTTK